MKTTVYFNYDVMMDFDLRYAFTKSFNKAVLDKIEKRQSLGMFSKVIYTLIGATLHKADKIKYVTVYARDYNGILFSMRIYGWSKY